MNTKRPVLLIVDDEETIHRALTRTFRREPYEIVHAYDAAEAWQIVEHGPPIAAMICDHYMDGTYGLDLLQQVRAKHPKVLTVLLTGHADLRLVIRAINEGLVHRFFTKPWEPDALRREIRELIRAGASASLGVVPCEETERQMAEQLLPQRDAGTGAFIIEAPDTP